MAEVLLRFQTVLVGTDGHAYVPRACAAANADGIWEGWIEFVPQRGGAVLRSPRETTQPKFSDAVYWASGLSPVYLEGALDRAMRTAAHGVAPPGSDGIAARDGPAPHVPVSTASGAGPTRASVLNPFTVAAKGHAHLRRQLSTLSPWHLVNVVRSYDLSHATDEALLRLSHEALIDTIVGEVVRRERTNAGEGGATTPTSLG